MGPRPPETATPVRLTLAGTARPDTVAEWRRALRRWLQQEVHAPEEVREDVVFGSTKRWRIALSTLIARITRLVP